jgi:hypothetical protein
LHFDNELPPHGGASGPGPVGGHQARADFALDQTGSG